MNHSGVNEGPLFISKLGNLDSEIANAVCEQLGLEPDELFNRTAIIKKIIRPKCGKKDAKISLAGDHIVAEKVLQLKLRVIIDECKLVTDKEVRAPSVLDKSDDSNA